MQRCGIVLEIVNGCAVVMSDDGEFCRVPIMATARVGQEIQWPVESVSTSRRLPTRSRYAVAGSVACALIALATWKGIIGFGPTEAEAYVRVSLDMNPSVVMVVTKNWKVISVQPTNALGSKLLTSLHISGESFQQAVQQLLQTAATKDMISAANGVLVATSPVEADVDIHQVQSAAEQVVEQALPTTISQTHVYGVSVSPNIWVEATKANLSPGKVATYVVAENEGITVDWSHLTAPLMTKIFSSVGKTEVAKSEVYLNTQNAIQQLLQIEQTGGHIESPAVANQSIVLQNPGINVTIPGVVSNVSGFDSSAVASSVKNRPKGKTGSAVGNHNGTNGHSRGLDGGTVEGKGNKGSPADQHDHQQGSGPASNVLPMLPLPPIVSALSNQVAPFLTDAGAGMDNRNFSNNGIDNRLSQQSDRHDHAKSHGADGERKVN